MLDIAAYTCDALLGCFGMEYTNLEFHLLLGDRNHSDGGWPTNPTIALADASVVVVSCISLRRSSLDGAAGFSVR